MPNAFWFGVFFGVSSGLGGVVILKQRKEKLNGENRT
jgi:hypothetical protein